jgi:hypothetical protein
VDALDGRLSLADPDGIARSSVVDDAPERDPAAARGYDVGEVDRMTGDFRGYSYETGDARYPLEGGYRR